MKKIFSTCILAICFSALIFSCSKDSTENQDDPLKKYRLTKKVYDDGFVESYYYNVNGQLSKISYSDGDFEEFYYNNENKLTKVISDSWVEDYYYKNGLLDFITFLTDSYIESPDTVFFKYNNKSLISQMVSSYSYNGITNRITHELTYDNGNRLISKVQIEMNSLSAEYDSTIYKWNTDGNILEMRHIYNYSADGVTYNIVLDQENYEYDSYLNYSTTIPYPESYIFKRTYLWNIDEQYSKNNVIEIRHKTEFGSSTRFYLVSESVDGLPKRIVGDYASWNLTYEII